MTQGTLASRARTLAGLLLLGQGTLALTGILDHEASLVMGAALAALGTGLLAWPLLRPAAPPPAPGAAVPQGEPLLPGRRARLVALLGALAVLGVVAYNALAGSGLALPELAIVAYGGALLVAAPHLSRRVGPTDVGTLVAYSFPLLLAPLGLYALNALLTSQAGATPLRWYVQHGLAAPMAALLGAGGYDATTHGETVRIATARGPLFLTVGVVCAGLYAGVLFAGVLGLFAWQQRTPPRRLVGYMALGLAGLHAANVLRLAMLGAVGQAWGGEALQAAHEHAGWLFFLAFTLAFWFVVLRRFEGPRRLGKESV